MAKTKDNKSTERQRGRDAYCDGKPLNEKWPSATRQGWLDARDNDPLRDDDDLTAAQQTGD